MNTRLEQVRQICSKYRVKALYAFGSRSAEILRSIENKNFQFEPSERDLDIGVLTDTPLSVDEKVSLTLALEDLFYVPRVDLVLLQDADTFLAANIIRGERIYAEDPYLADEYELFVLGYAGELLEIERSLVNM